MKVLLTAALAVLFITTAAAQQNPHVRIEAKAPSAMKAGAAQDVKITFRPTKGIHINLDPSPEIETAKASVVATIGTLSASKDAHGYLNAAKPAVVPVTIAADAPKGRQTLKLRIVYYLCSDKEGWCNRDEQTIDIPVTVK